MKELKRQLLNPAFVNGSCEMGRKGGGGRLTKAQANATLANVLVDATTIPLRGKDGKYYYPERRPCGDIEPLVGSPGETGSSGWNKKRGQKAKNHSDWGDKVPHGHGGE